MVLPLATALGHVPLAAGVPVTGKVVPAVDVLREVMPVVQVRSEVVDQPDKPAAPLGVREVTAIPVPVCAITISLLFGKAKISPQPTFLEFTPKSEPDSLQVPSLPSCQVVLPAGK